MVLLNLSLAYMRVHKKYKPIIMSTYFHARSPVTTIVFKTGVFLAWSLGWQIKIDSVAAPDSYIAAFRYSWKKTAMFRELEK